jgi:phosphomethylpyrimidine synthase
MKQKDTTPTENKISREPFTGSNKIYVKGTLHPDIEVAMREISCESTKGNFHLDGKERTNPSVVVYDTSGPYTDSNKEIDIYKGLAPLRKEWILKRGDVEQLGDFSSDYAHERSALEKTIDKDILTP